MELRRSASQARLSREMREFAAEAAGGVGALDASEEFAWDLWNGLAHRGGLGLLVPEPHGGAGASVGDAAAAVLGFARGGGDLGTVAAWATHLAATRALGLLGAPELAAEVLPDAARGGAVLAAPLAPALDPTSEAFSPARAVAKDHVWVLGGELAWIESALVASHYLLPARFEEGAAAGGVAAVLVERVRHGVVVAGRLSKLGQRTATTGTVHLTDVEVPQGHGIGPARQGLERVLVPIAVVRRVLLAAGWAGTLGFAAERLAEGAPDRAAARAAAQSAGLELLALRVAERIDAGAMPLGETAALGRAAARYALEAATDAVGAAGPGGLRFGHWSERLAREALWSAGVDAPGGLFDQALAGQERPS